MRLMRLMKPVALAVLIALVPATAMAQNPQSSGKKMKWIALGSIIGGATFGAFAAFTGNKQPTATNTSAFSQCTSPPITSSSSAITQVCIVGTPTAPAIGNAPTTIQMTFGAGSVRTSALTLANSQQRTTNWKLAGPAIGATSVGAFLLYRYHVRVKKADVSLRPDGAVQLAFTW
jgi:hypothetical protein